MIKKLTKQSKIDLEEKRISGLTNDHNAYFKLIMSHQVESGFNYNALHSPRGGRTPYNQRGRMKVLMALGSFLDKSIKMTITDVESTYGRLTDTRDATFDPETKDEAQIEHMCLYPRGAQPNAPVDSVRLHGYFRTNGGYFIVTRLDWYHRVHGSA